jgi:hypothetical protein
VETYIADVRNPGPVCLLLPNLNETACDAVFHPFGVNLVIAAFRAFGRQKADLDIFENIGRKSVHLFLRFGSLLVVEGAVNPMMS